MTRERRENILVVAVAVSVALHILLVFVARGRVMSHGVDEKYRAHPRRHVQVERLKTEPKVEMVRISEMDDSAAKKNAPEAESSGAPAPEQARVEVVSPLPVAAPPSDAAVPSAPLPPSERFAVESVKVEAGPKLEEKLQIVTEAPSARIVAAAPDAVLPDLGTGARIVATAPMEGPRLAIPAEVPVAAPKDLPESGPKAPEFVPSNEVYSKVDAAVVEAEKAAVRGLLDAGGQAELSSAVTFAAEAAVVDGWRYFRVKVRPTSSLEVVPKDFVLLMDASGSIGDERMRSLKAACRLIMRSAMNSGDRFNLVAFRNRFSYAFKGWRECTEATYEAAEKWLGNVASFGRTDVFASIESVLTLPRDPARPLIALVVTDGEANSGVSSTEKILSRFTALNDGLVSVYMYGVKSDANRELIESLTRGNRGESFIYGGLKKGAGSRLEGLTDRFRDPVLTDMRVVFSSSCHAEAYPRALKNLYAGGETEITGRVPAAEKTLAFSLRGLSGRNAYEGFFRLPLDKAADFRDAKEMFEEEVMLDRKVSGERK